MSGDGSGAEVVVAVGFEVYARGYVDDAVVCE